LPVAADTSVKPVAGEQCIEEVEEVTPEMKTLFDSYDVPPKEFIKRSNEKEEEQFEGRKRMIYARSIESAVGHSSLLRTLSNAYIEQVAYYRSDEGGALPLEEARARAYRKCENEEEAHQLFSQMMSIPVNWITLSDLLRMIGFAPRTAENVWEMMKREAQNEVESGHLASKALIPVHYMQEAWAIASYLGLRESLAAEWEPRGGIELNLIDMLAQAFLQYQYWVKESVLRTQTAPRTEEPEYTEWKQYKSAAAKANGWSHGWWDIPYVKEQESIEHAAQMADRWNRIYMRTLRNLRDLRRYSVPVTINNPQQVNIAADGGQQVNVASTE
jgi:hypothetical protein